MSKDNLLWFILTFTTIGTVIKLFLNYYSILYNYYQSNQIVRMLDTLFQKTSYGYIYYETLLLKL